MATLNGLLTGEDRRAVGLKWLILVALSALLAVMLEAMRLPAALLLGPMFSAIMVASLGWSIRVPPGPNLVAQAVIGCMIARSIPLTVVSEILRHGLLFIMVVAAVI